MGDRRRTLPRKRSYHTGFRVYMATATRDGPSSDEEVVRDDPCPALHASAERVRRRVPASQRNPLGRAEIGGGHDEPLDRAVPGRSDRVRVIDSLRALPRDAEGRPQPGRASPRRDRRAARRRSGSSASTAPSAAVRSIPRSSRRDRIAVSLSGRRRCVGRSAPAPPRRGMLTTGSLRRPTG